MEIRVSTRFSMQDKKNPITIEIAQLNKSVVASQEDTILEALLKAKIPIDHSCGGMASCGTCLVEVESGLENFSDRNELEVEMAEDRKFRKEERLACQNSCSGNIRIKY